MDFTPTVTEKFVFANFEEGWQHCILLRPNPGVYRQPDLIIDERHPYNEGLSYPALEGWTIPPTRQWPCVRHPDYSGTIYCIHRIPDEPGVVRLSPHSTTPFFDLASNFLYERFYRTVKKNWPEGVHFPFPELLEIMGRKSIGRFRICTRWEDMGERYPQYWDILTRDLRPYLTQALVLLHTAKQICDFSHEDFCFGNLVIKRTPATVKWKGAERTFPFAIGITDFNSLSFWESGERMGFYPPAVYVLTDGDERREIKYAPDSVKFLLATLYAHSMTGPIISRLFREHPPVAEFFAKLEAAGDRQRIGAAKAYGKLKDYDEATDFYYQVCGDDLDLEEIIDFLW